MESFKRVDSVLCLCVVLLMVSTSSQNPLDNTKTVGLQDPNLDGTVKSVLENGSVSEVVVRKDLLLFPINAPNLVIAHTQEIHAVPENATISSDGKPTAAEVAEVNEYSLSQLVSTNETDSNTNAEHGNTPVTSIKVSQQSQNKPVMEPSKLLEIISAYNPSNGLATEKDTLPNEEQNIPEKSTVDLLSQMTTTTEYFSSNIVKRSVDAEEDNDDSDSTEEHSAEETSDNEEDASNSCETSGTCVDSVESMKNDSNSDDMDQNNSNTSSSELAKRWVDSDEDDDSDGNESTSIIPESENSNSTEIEKRSVIETTEDDEQDLSSNTTTAHYDQMVRSSPTELNSINLANEDAKNFERTISTPDNLWNTRKSFRQDSDEEMRTAEDIVFRPLFRYRQETRTKQDYFPRRRFSYERHPYNSYSDYENR